MGIIWNLFRKVLPHDEQVILKWIEKEVKAGRMSHAEAEERRAELEQTLHKVFDAEEDKDKS